MSSTGKTKDEVLALVATLQSPAESIEARCAACDAVMQLTKMDSACSMICSAGGVHAVINTIKAAADCEPLLKGAVLALRNLHRFDSKLTSIVVRLQEGIGAMLEGLREHIHCADPELLEGLLSILNEVAANVTNVQVVVKENGTAVILACVLAHLKNEQLLLPALHLLTSISRQANHIPTLVREGAVPAILAAILAHLRRVEVLRAALVVLRNIVADDSAAQRLGGQGAYRIVFAVLQTHAAVEQMELIRMGASVLWRIHHARAPPTQLLHSQLVFEPKLDHNGTPISICDVPRTIAPVIPRPVAVGGARDVELRTHSGATAGGMLPDANCDDADSDCGDEGGDEPEAAAQPLPRDLAATVDDSRPGSVKDGGGGLFGRLHEEDVPSVPYVSLRFGGHAEWIEACPPELEGLSASSSPATHAELVVKAITADAERLMAPAARTKGVEGDEGTPYPRVVYDAYPSEGVSPHSGVGEGSLTLDAAFESANLRRAVQVGPHEYNLVLSCDVNTRGHTQWFLFRARDMAVGVLYRFNLINLMKPDSLFSSGMRPLMYSEKTAKKDHIGWSRCADEIAYYMNQYTYAAAPKKAAMRKGAPASAAAAPRENPVNSFYTLTFTVAFPHAGDTCYISQCYPYTYSMQQAFSSRLVTERHSGMIRREVLCYSYAGNSVDLFSVTDFSSPSAEIASRKVVVISARVHPGESNASWMMHGLLEAVIADTPAAKLLRKTLMLKIVPMLNPDGVILGNYRCSVVGVDLNRQWQDPHETNMPTIYALKRLMKGFVANDQLLLFCDFHGHSRKRNIFAYGCEALKGPMRLKERVFPRLLSDCAHFALGGCSFRVLKSKETTGRVVVHRQFATPNSFTLEASFCGADFGPGAGSHFNISHLKEMGAAFVPALIDFTDPSQTRVHAILAELEAQFPAPDEEDEAEGAEGGGKEGSSEVLSETSEKLRRTVRRTRTAANGSVKGTGGSANAANISSRRKPVPETKDSVGGLSSTKKKKKQPG